MALVPGDNNRINGKMKVHRALANLPDGKPGLIVFRTCANLIRTLPALPYDPIRVEDVDSKAEDHAYDALRYGFSEYVTKVAATAKDIAAQRRWERQQERLAQAFG